MGAAADVDGAICSIEHFRKFQADATGSTCDDIDAAAEIVERFFSKGRGRWEDLGKIRHCKVVSMLFTRDLRDGRLKKVLFSILQCTMLSAFRKEDVLVDFICRRYTSLDFAYDTQTILLPRRLRL